jgi:glycosyltransferase involved in cell wall biosynthesis
MRIAQVAPLVESVPPKGYGGTERVVSYLTEELVRLGHDVTLFASGDSTTRARLVGSAPRALRLDGKVADALARHICQLEDVFRDPTPFDVIHLHTDYLHFSLSSRQPTPCLTTLHGRLDLPELVEVYRRFPRMPVVSISNAQRAPLPWLAWQGTVYHGLPDDAYAFRARARPEDYLAFLGRISPEKRVDRAIEIARRARRPLRVAAKIDPVDRAYYERSVASLLKSPGVEFLGEIGEADKAEFLGGAAALLFPVDWPEPFGLVVVEAMACGTPVIAYPRGSVPELVEHGVTGFIVRSVRDAERAVARLPQLDRGRIRRRFKERFTASRMARDYLGIYERLVEAGRSGRKQSA